LLGGATQPYPQDSRCITKRPVSSEIGSLVHFFLAPHGLCNGWSNHQNAPLYKWGRPHPATLCHTLQNPQTQPYPEGSECTTKRPITSFKRNTPFLGTPGLCERWSDCKLGPPIPHKIQSVPQNAKLLVYKEIHFFLVLTNCVVDGRIATWGRPAIPHKIRFVPQNAQLLLSKEIQPFLVHTNCVVDGRIATWARPAIPHKIRFVPQNAQLLLSKEIQPFLVHLGKVSDACIAHLLPKGASANQPRRPDRTRSWRHSNGLLLVRAHYEGY
jgi:hypothetical protein